jgi:hypothetical protein
MHPQPNHLDEHLHNEYPIEHIVRVVLELGLGVRDGVLVHGHDDAVDDDQGVLQGVEVDGLHNYLESILHLLLHSVRLLYCDESLSGFLLAGRTSCGLDVVDGSL